ncbi:hypothetical protein CSA56_10850 [candidate division KSB3 bacterium]|uniref:Lipid A biosynthesis N-terminal domain-containing protein n=1 Tax=candidate division KSB3 bacterium TaxID=2044937 RepID=A0A2G6KD68_9BACT|nr:MAG: hypothetical protein CSA56_10850 [candidate division KSB3 bacterium]
MFQITILGWVFDVDLWVIMGLFAQGMFFMRFFIQWIISERRRKSTVPPAFWVFSVLGGTMLFIYAFHRRDLVIMLGQAGGLVIYARNLMLIYNESRRTRCAQEES